MFLLNSQNSSALLPFGVYFGGRVYSTGGIEKGFSSPELYGKEKLPLSLAFNLGIRLFSFRLEIEPNFFGIIAGEQGNLNLKNALDSYQDAEGNQKHISGFCGLSVLANLYYNLVDLTFFKFYLNGGMGKTWFSKFSTLTEQEKLFTNDPENYTPSLPGTGTTAFTWLMGAGVTFSLFNVINLDIGYRFIHFNNLKLENYKLDGNSINAVYTGLRLGF
jgi:opacity protein-like surface antigen